MLTALQVATCDRWCGAVESFVETSQPYHKLMALGWTIALSGSNQLTVCPACSKKEAADCPACAKEAAE